MRVRLKGINPVRKRLASGEVVTYWYAWKGGPRLEGKPGSPEFIASYNRAVAERRKQPDGILQSIIDKYQLSDDFRSRRDRYRADIIKKIRQIEASFSDFPLKALSDPRARTEFLEWRDRLAINSRRQADYSWTVLARILSWAKNRNLVTHNPCEKGGRLYRGTRVDKIWTEDDEANFFAKAPPHLHLPVMLALWTGQRQGDLLRLPWSAYDGAVIRLHQSKTGQRVKVPVGAPLKAMLDATPRKSPLILVNSDGVPWTEDGFRSSFGKARAAAGIVGVTFNDLRGTAVTRLALCECTEAEIVAITGHKLSDVRSILDSNYLHRDPALAESAIRKLEKGTKTPN